MMLLVPAVPFVTALVLAAGTVQPSYAAEPTPTPDASRAGSLAGEGRERPGRDGAYTGPGEVGTDDPEAGTDDPKDTGMYRDTEAEAARPTDAPQDPRAPHDPHPSEPSRDAALSDQEALQEQETDQEALQKTDQEAVAQPDAIEGPVLRALPLGSGLILIGLGLGLAFLALRFRRA